MKYSPLLFFMMIIGVVTAQDKHDNVWIFGHKPNIAQRNFGGTMISFNENNFNSNYFEINCNLEENSSFCDEGGSIVLYTDGCSIYGSDHKIIENGDSLNPGPIYNSYCTLGEKSFYSSNNTTIFIPGFNADTVYLFHVGRNSNALTGIFYKTAIYQSMDKKFTVAYKNKIYGYLAAMEGLQAVRHGNGRDWWFVLKERGSARFNIYLHTPNGLFGPYNQTIGPVWEYPLQIVQATFSPDGNYYAIASQANGIHLFHFDRCTGELYRYLPLKYPPEDYRFYPMGFAFSPNSKVLYLSSYFSIYQYDLEARVIVNSYTLIDTLDGFSPPGSFPLTFYQLNLAPDHKIYCNTTNETNVLHVIHDPDKKGKACNLKQHDIYLPTSYIQSMPNFPPYRLYDKDGSICDTLGIDKVVHADFRYQQDTSQYLSFNFIDLTAYQPEAWQWNFGDPASANNTSTEQNPYHRFSAEGTYSVCLTAYNKHGSSEACKTIQIGTVNTKNNKAPYKFSKVLLQSPNPVCEILQININEYFPKNLQLYLINRLGQQVLSQRIYHGNNAVSLQGIKSGIYWAQWVESGRIVHSESLYIDGTGY